MASAREVVAESNLFGLLTGYQIEWQLGLTGTVL